MKFRATVHDGGQPWEEIYDYDELVTLEDAWEWMTLVLDSFNRSLRPSEKPRILLNVYKISESCERKRCGITGKRLENED